MLDSPSQSTVAGRVRALQYQWTGSQGSLEGQKIRQTRDQPDGGIKQSLAGATDQTAEERIGRWPCTTPQCADKQLIEPLCYYIIMTWTWWRDKKTTARESIIPSSPVEASSEASACQSLCRLANIVADWQVKRPVNTADWSCTTILFLSSNIMPGHSCAGLNGGYPTERTC